jgi:predicted DsbA family dithiol-disulfide isomerase
VVEMPGAGVVEVYADVCCPFTHVGLVRFVQARAERGVGPVLHVRSWPLELVNGRPLDPAFIAEEVEEIREQVAPDLFTGFREDTFPPSSLPAMALAAAGYRKDLGTGEQVSLALRRALFEDGLDIADRSVLATIAEGHGLSVDDADEGAVVAEWERGKGVGVIGSPHFFTPGGGFFCPALDIARVDGHLRITADQPGFNAFLASCFA